MKWWNKDILTISAVQCKYHETSEDIFDHYVKESGFNTEQLLHLTANGHVAFYNEERDGKKLDEYLKRTKKAGVKEIVYVNIHGVNAEDHEKHPEYSLLDKDGNALTVYGAQYYICLNGPYFEEHIKNMKELCKHDIDGIFLDGPSLRADACYCDACLKKFEEQYGKSKYEAEYYERIEFNTRMATAFVKATCDAVREVNPNILVYINNTLLIPEGIGTRARDIEPYVDMIGTEGGFVWMERGTPLWHASPKVKMAETVSCGKSRVCFIAGDLKPWSYYMHTPCEINILYAQSIAYGANVWFGLHGSSKQGETPGGRAATEFNSFIRKHNDTLVNTQSCSRIALFWSDATAARYSTSVEEADFVHKSMELGSDKEFKSNQAAAFKGMYDILTRAHIQFDLIDEISFQTGQHKKYDTIIMTTAACISDEIADIVKDYVKEGGKLISDFDTGFYNELCEKREKSVLSEIQGIKSNVDMLKYLDGCGYLVTNPQSFVFDGVCGENIPLPLLSAENEFLDSAEVLGWARKPLEGRYVDLIEETYPSIVYHQYGKGESIYFSGAVGEFFDRYANPDWKKLVVNAVNHFSHADLMTDAPGSVEVSLRKKEGKYLIHLVNLTGEMVRPIERIIELNHIGFKLNTEFCVTSVKTLRSQENLKFEQKGNKIQFTLPLLKNHEIIVIE
ncbi:MAG: hypothetical protein E7399_08840 [Ruminococcaceae bacterium]|nr:hypothetical protein [Oscillospiraceae bacterium]